jgi:ubiquinone/menaquinone biosynthesis C-methylase UbiE
VTEPAPHQFRDVAEIYDSLMSVVPYRQWVDYVEQLWLRFQCRPRRVLDLACGTGNVTEELARRGYEVVGVDSSAEMLRAARRKAPRLTFVEQDARALALPERFDAAVCLFDSLNYLLELADLEAALRGVRRHLEPEGLFIFDLNAIRALEQGMFDQQGHGRDDTVAYVWRSHYFPDRRLCRIDMRFYVHEPAGTREFTETHWQRGYTLAEVTRALADAGLHPLAVFDAFTFRPPTARSDRLYFVAAALTS